MDIEISISLPKLIYDIYADAAKKLGNYSTAQVLSSALVAYARYLFDEMQEQGELSKEHE